VWRILWAAANGAACFIAQCSENNGCGHIAEQAGRRQSLVHCHPWESGAMQRRRHDARPIARHAPGNCRTACHETKGLLAVFNRAVERKGGMQGASQRRPSTQIQSYNLWPFAVSISPCVKGPPHNAHFSSLMCTLLSSAIFGVVATGEAGLTWPPPAAASAAFFACATRSTHDILTIPQMRRRRCTCFRSDPASKSSRLKNLEGRSVKGLQRTKAELTVRGWRGRGKRNHGRVLQNVSCSSLR
jgi:hypothetical protein